MLGLIKTPDEHNFLPQIEEFNIYHNGNISVSAINKN